MFKKLKKSIFPRKTLQGLRNSKAMQRFLDFPLPLQGAALAVGTHAGASVGVTTHATGSCPMPDKVGEVVVVQACQQYLSPVNQDTRNQACLTHFRRKLGILKIHPDTRFPVEILAPAGGGSAQTFSVG